MGGTSSKNQHDVTENKHPDSANSLRQRREDVKTKEDNDVPNLQQDQNTRPRTLNVEELLAFTLDPKDYSYPFENLVFEGGGAKGIAYAGVIKVLEDVNILPQIKRFAGTSIGSMVAATLAVGYNSSEVKELMYQDLSYIFNDSNRLSFLPNIIRHYGMNSGKRLHDWLGKVISKKTADPEITFSQVYGKYGVELCVVATNLNHMKEEYFHPKTTPDMPIRLAVRMSMSYPGMMKAVPYSLNGQTNLYIDGGVLCNYPVHCFDGWWLSMAESDSFLERLHHLEDLPKLLSQSQRFDGHNDKTLGMLLFADSEDELFRAEMDCRVGATLPKFPDTFLANRKIANKHTQESVFHEQRRASEAVRQFLIALKKHDIANKGSINKEEMKAVFSDEDFTQKHADILFGKDANVEMAFSILDEDKKGKIHYHELIHFVENTGVFLSQRFYSCQRRDISDLGSYLTTLYAALSNITKKVYIEDRDLTRTVGINTGYILSPDLNLVKTDKDYIVQQGENGMISYLKCYVATQLMKEEKEKERLEQEQDRQIHYHELIHFVENTGVFLSQRFYSCQRRDISDLGSYLTTLYAALSNITKKVYIEDRDLTRTVGINTGYILSPDLNLVKTDKDYIVQQGENGMISYLKCYVATQLMKEEKEKERLEQEQDRQVNDVICEQTQQLKNEETE